MYKSYKSIAAVFLVTIASLAFLAIHSAPSLAQSVTPQYVPITGATMTGQLMVNKFNPTSQQANIGDPIIFDNFIYADGTQINGKRAESGNSTWSVSGANASNAVTLGTYLRDSFGPGGNFYASLLNTATNGGTAVPVHDEGVEFMVCPSDNTPYDPTQARGTLIAQRSQLDLNNMLHLNFSAAGYSLTKRLAGGSFIPVLSNSWPPLLPDCSTPHAFAMHINETAGTVTVTDPAGRVQTATDSDITTINPVAGTWQITGADVGPNLRFGRVWIGKNQADKVGVQGLTAAASDLGQINGIQATRRFVQPTFTIPNAAGGGGSGWYRIATGAADVAIILKGDFTISAATNVQTQYLKFHLATSSTQVAPFIQQDDDYSTGLIDQVTLSNDGGSNAALDIHLGSTANANAVTLNILGVGIMTPATIYPVGAVAYTHASTLSVTASTPSLNVTLSGGAGWYTIFTAATTCGGFCAAGTMSFQASSNATYNTFTIFVRNTTSACEIIPLWSSGTSPIGQLRCSWDASHVQIDMNDGLGAGSPVTLTGNLFGQFTINTNPTVGAVVLGSGSNTYSNVFGGLGALPISSFSVASGAFLTGNQGNGTLLQHGSGSPSTGNLLSYDANGNAINSTLTANRMPTSVTTCGTTTTCSNTVQTAPRIVWGTVTLSGGTATVGSITTFTGNATFDCTANDNTAANAVKVVNTAANSITLTGTGTDTVSYICVGN